MQTSSNISHTKLSWSLHETIIIILLPNDNFLTPSLPLHLLVLSTLRRTFSFFYFLFIYLYSYRLIDAYSCNRIKIFTIIYLDTQIILHLVSGSPCWGGGSSFLLAYSPHAVNSFLLSGTSRYYRHILFFSCPSLEISHFFKERWFFWVFRDQDLGIRCAQCFLGVIHPRPCLWEKQKVDTYVHSYTSVLICISIC